MSQTLVEGGGQVDPSSQGRLLTILVAGGRAKLLLAGYLMVTLGLISLVTLPQSLLASFPLLMFAVNAALAYLFLSDLRLFRGNIFGALGTAIVLSIGVQSFFFVALTNSPIRWLSFFILSIVSLSLLLLNKKWDSVVHVQIRVVDTIVLASLPIVTGVFFLFFRFAHPLGKAQEFIGLPADVPLFGSIIQSIVRSGLSETGFVAGYPLKYHWLTYGFLGSLDSGETLDLIPLITYFTPLLLFFTLLLLIASVSSVPWMPAISPLLGLFGTLALGSVGVWRNTEMSIFSWFSPSTLLGGVLILSLSIIVVHSLRTGLSWQGIALAIVLSNFLFLAKISAGITFVFALLVLATFFVKANREALRNVIPLLTIAGVVGLFWYLVLFSGTGNEIGLDPNIDLTSTFALNTVIMLGVPLAAVIAVAVPWAGILIRNGAARKLELEQILAISLGLPAIVIYGVTTAPDQNDKFFIIAAGIYIFPISFLASVRFLRSRNLSQHRMSSILYFGAIILVGVALSFFANLNFFDVRPLAFPLVTLAAAAALALVMSRWTSLRPRDMSSIANSFFTTLVIISISFSMSQVIAPRIGVDLRSQPVYISAGSIDIIEDYIGETLVRVESQSNNTDATISFLVKGADANTIERWVRFSSGKPSFSSGETDVKRLSTVASENTLFRRNTNIAEFSETGSPGSELELCREGLNEIWVYSSNGEPDQLDSAEYSSPSNLQILKLTCPSKE